jgi:hypothetical protein
MADKSEDKLRGYIVISKTLVDTKKYAGCKMIPYGNVYPAIFRKVYGPDGKRECEQWMASHCSK